MKSYSIALDPVIGKPASITCHRCGKTSYHLEDVLHRYCASAFDLGHVDGAIAKAEEK